GAARRVAQGQTPQLFGGALVCRARLSRQTGDREQRQEDTGRGWRTRGDSRAESRSSGPDRTVAALLSAAAQTTRHPQEERETALPIDPDPGRSGTTGGLLTSATTACRNSGRLQLLRVSAQTPMRGCD